MPTLLQINSVANTGSTGHIAEDIGKLALAHGWKSYIAYGRKALTSESLLIRIGNKLDILWHVFVTRLFDLHGLASRFATKKFVRQIERIKPDVIHLHNIHGYYLNYKILFKYLAKSGVPVVWTLHDCWALTGHCSHYTFAKCEQWETSDACKKCPQKKSYPSCKLFSHSAYNFKCKKKYFNLLKENQLTLVTPSQWLCDEIDKSYLGHFKHIVIHNGIDLNVFKPVNVQDTTPQKKLILGVASVWENRKGLADFIKLAALLQTDEEIILVGLSESQIKSLPKDKNIHGIRRTESQQQLAELYSEALVYFNASVEETFGMTCAEALACGTPVIAYNSTAVPETISNETGIVVEPNNIQKVYEAFQYIKQKGKHSYTNACRERAEKLYGKTERFEEYIKLYKVK